MPNMYARGILFGKMVLELGDTCIAKNEKNGMLCDIEFKTKVCTHTVTAIVKGELTNSIRRAFGPERIMLLLGGYVIII